MTELNLFQKLLQVKKDVGYIQKKKLSNDLNYKAVSNSMVLGEINTELNKHGVLLKMSVISKDIQRLERIKVYKDTQSTVYDYIANLEMEYTWINTDKPEEQDKNFFVATGLNTDPAKALGSALTYAEKYFFLKYFNIASDDLDPDTYKNIYDNEEEIKPKVKIDNNQPNNSVPKQEKIITMQTEAEKKETKRKELEELMQTKAKAGVKVFTDWYQTYITKYPSVLQNKEFLDLVAKHDPTPKTPEDFERAKNLAMQEALEKSQKIS